MNIDLVEENQELRNKLALALRHMKDDYWKKQYLEASAGLHAEIRKRIDQETKCRVREIYCKCENAPLGKVKELMEQVDKQRETIKELEDKISRHGKWWTERDDSNERMKRRLKDKLAEMVGLLERNM